MKTLIFSLSALALTTVAIAPAQADVRVGTLGCDVAPSVSYIIGSQKMINCVFYSANGTRERYVGSITRIGLDVGWTTGGKLGWWVYAPSRPGHGALAGGYIGASAEATAAAGVTANALVGSANSITLQPFSAGMQGGLDLAVTVSGMRLDAVRERGRRSKRR